MTTVPALTALRLGYKDPLTDTFGAHPLLGAVLDLNDGRAFTLAAPDGFTLSAPRRTLVPVDGSLLTALVNNPSNAPFAVTNQWLWDYFDGLGMAAGGDPAWTYSLESSAQPNAAQALSDGTLDWGSVARTALAASAVAVLLALVKYARAFGDPPLDGVRDAASEPGQSDLAGDGAN
jgi:hypothetical protein